MLNIMHDINNHFIPYHNVPEYESFEIVTDGIIGPFDEVYLPGMYIIIQASFLNNGIYKIKDVTGNKITVEETLQAENTDKSFFIIASNPPDDFISLVSKIDDYKQSDNKGIKSKKSQDLGVTYSDDTGWKNAFKDELSQYRKLYSDFEKYPFLWNYEDLYYQTM